MKPLSNKKRNVILSIFIFLFICFIPVMFLYVTGYRLGTGYSLIRTGGIYIHPWNVRGNVYLNDKLITTANFLQKDHLIQSLPAKIYSISVKRDGYSIWEKEIPVYKQIVTEVSPFIISYEPEVITIPKFILDPLKPKGKGTPNPLYIKIEPLFADKTTETVLPEMETLPTTKDGKLKEDYLLRRKMALWQQGETIYAEWTGEQDSIPAYFCESELRINCAAVIPVIKNAKNVTQFDFYPGRNDILIAAFPDGLYAVELDTRSTQNSALIFAGKNLDFRIQNSDLLYVKKDSSTFLKITIE